MATDREIDVAFVLEGVPSVVAVYALGGEKGGRDANGYDFAVEVRPLRGLVIAEVHYRLRNVLTQAECGRVLFVDAAGRAPLPMHRARALVVPSGAREEATLRAMQRVEGIAKRYEEEREQASALTAKRNAEGPASFDSLDYLHTLERYVDVQLALERFAPFHGVFVVERRRCGTLTGLDVFVELSLDPDVIFEAHRRVVDYRYGAIGRILYGNAEMRLRYGGERIPFDGSDRTLSERRREFAYLERPVLDWGPLKAAIERRFAEGTPTSPVALDIDDLGRSDDVDGLEKRPRVLLVHPDGRAAAPHAFVGGDVDLFVTDDGWAALDLLHATKFDLVISALRLGEMRGVQLYRAAVAADPALAERFYFVTTQGAHDAAPSSSAMAKVLTSPLDPDDVRRLLGLV